MRREADAIATAREGEESRRRDIAEARRRVRESLSTFNRGRRSYYRAKESGAWDEPHFERQRARMLDSILYHVPTAEPWGTERGFELCPALAERAERERVAAMTADEKRAAWQAGELPAHYVRELEREAGPLLRAVGAEIDGCTVSGGTLETSQGATVPLRHAFRVFQFIALCRAEGKRWTPGAWGPRQIRVGHFRVDSVAPSGDFVAGCHSIKWPEVESLASRLGVADCLAPLADIAGELAD